MVGMDKVFLYSAIFGGAIFVIRIILQFTGALSMNELDLPHGDVADTHDDPGGGTHDTSFNVFQYLSLSVLSSFFMMFGLVGLTAHQQFGAPLWLSLGLATLGGAGMVKVVRVLMRSFMKLEQEGNKTAGDYVGVTGEVTVGIGEKPGVVSAVHDGVQMEFKAISTEGGPVKRGVLVKIVDVKDGLVVVTPVQ